MGAAPVGVNACRPQRACPAREPSAPSPAWPFGARAAPRGIRHAVAAPRTPPSKPPVPFAPRRPPTVVVLVERTTQPHWFALLSVPHRLFSRFPPPPSPPPIPPPPPRALLFLVLPLHIPPPLFPPSLTLSLSSPPCRPPLSTLPPPTVTSQLTRPSWWPLRAVAWARPCPCASPLCGCRLLVRCSAAAPPLATEGAAAPFAWRSAGQWCRRPRQSRARPAVPAAGGGGGEGAERRALISPVASLALRQQQRQRPRQPRRRPLSCLRCSRHRSGGRWRRRRGRGGRYQIRWPRTTTWRERRERRGRQRWGPRATRHRCPRQTRRRRRAVRASHACPPFCGRHLPRRRRSMLAGAPRQRLEWPAPALLALPSRR